MLRLPNGVIVTLLHDDNVPVLVVPLVEWDPCAPDADPIRVIAKGTGNVRGTDNDADVSRTRVNACGQRLTGKVADKDGKTWSVQAHFRARITQDDEFILVRESINLKKRGK